MTIFAIAAPDLAIDLGTINTLVYRKNKGIIINEPSCVAMDINNGQIVALGTGAYEMEGKTPSNIVVFRALDDGVIADYEITRTLLKYFLDKSISGLSLLSPGVVISVPTGITDVERRAVEDAVIQAGARDVLLIEEPLASLAGIREDIFEPGGDMVINFGGGITEIAVTSMGRIVCSTSIRVGGESINRDIVDFIKDRHKVLIGEATAEEIKLEIGSLSLDQPLEEYTITGRDIGSGLPTQLVVRSDDIQRILAKPVKKIIDGVNFVLERTPPELVSNIMKRGIVVTGGSSRINGLIPYLSAHIDLALEKDPDPFTSTVVGAGKFISKFTEIKKTRVRKHI